MILRDKATGAERSLIRGWSYVYEWTSDQGVEWALKPPLQSLCGWRRNAQDLLQLVERPAFVGFHCAGGSSVEQDSPAEPKMVARAALLVENGPGPAKSRPRSKKPPPHQCNQGCRGKKSPERTGDSATRADAVAPPSRPPGTSELAPREDESTRGVGQLRARATYPPTLPSAG